MKQIFQGIGSKLMCKMGYIVGTGLGPNGSGRVDPVQAYVYPQGVSLGKFLKICYKFIIFKIIFNFHYENNCIFMI